MNVSKIQRLSQQHKMLKTFHETCNRHDVELTIKEAIHPNPGGILSMDVTQSIIVEVRHIILKRIEEVEEEIRKAATRL